MTEYCLTQLGVDVAGISIDRMQRGVDLPDACAELAECERLARTMTVEGIEAIHQRLREQRAEHESPDKATDT